MMISAASIFLGSAFGAFKLIKSAKEFSECRRGMKKCDIALKIIRDPEIKMEDLAEKLAHAAESNPKIFKRNASRSFQRNLKRESVSS